MRVTEYMMLIRTQRYVSESFKRLGAAQEALVSGVRIQKPSDDPVVIGQLYTVNEALAKVGVRERTLDRAGRWLATTEAALGDITSTIRRVHDLALASANSPMNDAERISILLEIEQAMAHLLDIANQRVDGRHIFAGHRTLTPPFDPPASVGGVPTYVGDGGEILRPLGGGAVMAVNVPGDALFNVGGIDPAAPDVFVSLSELHQRILDADVEAISDTSLADLESIANHFLKMRATLGTGLQRVGWAQEVLLDAELRAESSRDQLVGLDVAEAIVAVQIQATAYEAALTATAHLLHVPGMLSVVA